MNVVDDAGLRWGVSLGAVLAVHAAVIGGGLWYARYTASLRVEAPMDAIAVELAPEPEAPEVPPSEVPPGPRQHEQPQQQVAEPKPEPKPKVELPPDVQPEVIDPLQQEERNDEQAEQEQTQVDRTLAPPDVSARTSDRIAAQQTLVGSSGNAAVTWQGRLLGHLAEHRRYPKQAERERKEGVVYVRFAVDRKGNVSDIRLGRTGGHATLDEETLATVRRASPVPPPPDEIEGNPVQVMVPVEFFIRRR